MTSIARTQRNRRISIVAFLLLALGGAAFFLIQALQSNFVYFVTPGDLQAAEIDTAQDYRLGGLVETGSVERLADGITVRFRVSDGAASVPVQFADILPDLFREGQGVVAEGRMTPGGLFMADRVLAKHDENYVPAEVAAALKERGQWRPEGE